MATRDEIIAAGGKGEGALPAGRRATTPAALVGWAWERFLYRVAGLGFDLVIVMAMALMLLVAVMALDGRVRLFQATVLLPTAIAAIVMFAKARQRPGEWRPEVGHILRDWVPFLIITFIYENMHDVAGQAMSFDIAGKLYGLDVAIFGVEPTLWAQRLFTPLATDLFSISYALYFFQPLFIMFLLSMWEMRREFRNMALALTITFILGFIGYVFLPASPPRYFIEPLFTDPPRLYGLFLFDHLQGAWDGLSVISGGAFPILHVALSTVALIYAWRFRGLNRTSRIVLYAYIPLVTSLWFSTVYLRHHWVMDVIAGWAVAGVAVVLADSLTRVWEGLRARYGLPQAL
jgi:membrane-associated phospholipid phosphatase